MPNKSVAKTDSFFKMFTSLKKLGREYGLSQEQAQTFAEKAMKLLPEKS